MKKKAVFKIDIPVKCSESWENMSPVEQGRFCDQCAKKVIDFTCWSDSEIVQYMRMSDNQVCGRFTGDQLNRNLLHLEKERLNGFIPALLLSTALTTGVAANAAAKEKEFPDNGMVVKADTDMTGVDMTEKDTSYTPPDLSIDRPLYLASDSIGIEYEMFAFQGFTVSTSSDKSKKSALKKKKKKKNTDR